jgi:hypothetical protein
MMTGLTISQRNPKSLRRTNGMTWRIVIDFAMASATARFAPGVNPEHLSKIWRISHEDAERTLDNTTHLLQRNTNPELSRNYGTNDRMLRYKSIRDYSTWIPSLLLSRVGNLPGDTHAANCL